MVDEETIADYDVRSPASRTLLTVIGTLVTAGLIIGVVLGLSILMRDTKVSRSTIDITGSTQVVIDAGSANLRIKQGDADVVRVTARITSGIRQTDFQIGRRGDEIKIVAGCQTWLSPGCGVDTTVELPPGIPVVVRTTSGDVDADAITEGVLTVQSDSGSIRGTGLTLDEFSATSGSGDVSAAFAEQPFAFKATTRDGDIVASLPAGKRTYAVLATSTSGKVSSSIASDDDGQGFIRARSSSGDVTLTQK